MKKRCLALFLSALLLLGLLPTTALASLCSQVFQPGNILGICGA